MLKKKKNSLQSISFFFRSCSFEVSSASNNVLAGTKIIDTGAGFLLEEDAEEDVSGPVKIVHEPGNCDTNRFICLSNNCASNTFISFRSIKMSLVYIFGVLII